MGERDCCCAKPRHPDGTIYRCLPRALDMGHCGTEEFAAEFCCGGVEGGDA